MRYPLSAICVALSLAGPASAAGPSLDIGPIDTSGLPELGDEWLTENPYRVDASSEEVWTRALEVGASGYNQNCARCHGIDAISGGLAPDLRFLEAAEYGDEWYVERFRYGYTQNGTTKMPEFGELLGQEAAWAIRTYIEARPDDQVVVDLTPELRVIRDELQSGSSADTSTQRAKLAEIASGIETLSGAPVADSIAYRASELLKSDPSATAEAAEILTIGLSAAE